MVGKKCAEPGQTDAIPKVNARIPHAQFDWKPAVVGLELTATSSRRGFFEHGGAHLTDNFFVYLICVYNPKDCSPNATASM